MEYRSRFQINLRQTKIFPILLAIVAFLCGWAALSGDSTLASDSFKVLGLIAFNSLTFLSICFVMFRRIKPSLAILLPTIIYFAFEYLHVYDSGHQNIGMSMLILIVLFGIITDQERLDVFYYYKKILYIMSVFAIVCYLAYLVKLPIPYKIVDYYAHTGVYVDFKVSYILSSGSILRTCGLFNEPGYFGTILALVLCANNIDLKEKENIIFIIAGVLSFSIAFFIIIFVYLIFKSIKNVKLAIALSAAVIVIPVALSSYSSISMDSNSGYFISRILNFSTAIQDRVYSSLGRMVDEWIHSNKLLFGYGSGYASGTGSSSYKIVLVRYGIIGFGLIYGSLIVPALYKAKKHFYSIIFIICFVINIYQRPFVFTLPYFIVLYGGIERLNNLENIAEKATER